MAWDNLDRYLLLQGASCAACEPVVVCARQARRRQVNLVGKILRELPDVESVRLEASLPGTQNDCPVDFLSLFHVVEVVDRS